MTDRIQQGGLQVAPFSTTCWRGHRPGHRHCRSRFFGRAWKSVITESGARKSCICWQVREDLQAKIDALAPRQPRRRLRQGGLQGFLQEIGYLLPEGDDFSITTRKCGP